MKSTPKSNFWTGARDGSPFVFVVFPFALLFGVVAVEAGLNVVEAMTFSIAVIAGAAQFVALQLMLEDAPTLVVIASALAVNLRMAMYSASLTPFLGDLPLWKRALTAYLLVDQSYAMSVLHYETHPRMTPAERFVYFLGVITPVIPLWYLGTLAGALIGSAIPQWLALDFAVPITFLAMLGPMMRTPAHRVAALVAVVFALLLAGLPYNLGLPLAGLAGMMAGARAELLASRRAARGAMP